jgi:hypothetical protein
MNRFGLSLVISEQDNLGVSEVSIAPSRHSQTYFWPFDMLGCRGRLVWLLLQLKLHVAVLQPKTSLCAEAEQRLQAGKSPFPHETRLTDIVLE